MSLVYAELNQRLLEVIPELEASYQEELKLWAPDIPGSHVMYGNLLVPLLEERLGLEGQEEILRRAFSLIEELSVSDDRFVREVVTDTICEYVVDRRELYSPAKELMGPRTAALCKSVETS